MKFIIKGKNIEITEAIENYITNRLSTLTKYFIIDDSTDINVLISVYQDEQKMEVTIPTQQATLRAESRNRDLYAAIDVVVEKLQSQIRKQKTKLKKHRTNKEKLGHAFNFEEIMDMEIEQDEAGNNIVRTKHLTPEAKDLETAILEMEMLNHNFYIFRSMEDENINIIYKRKNGGYGIIETDWNKAKPYFFMKVLWGRKGEMIDGISI